MEFVRVEAEEDAAGSGRRPKGVVEEDVVQSLCDGVQVCNSLVTYICVYTHICICLHTHTHTHTHTHITHDSCVGW